MTRLADVRALCAMHHSGYHREESVQDCPLCDGTHRYSLDEDRCVCGGEVVWFEDGDKFGIVGEGCAFEEITWKTGDGVNDDDEEGPMYGTTQEIR